MKWTLAGLATVFAMQLHVPAPADACGVKLTVKSGAPKKNVARSSNPSQVLLLGSPPRRLERDLVAAGHRVDTAPTPAAAKKKQYAVVITDPTYQNEARANYQGSTVLVRSNDVVADVRSVENQVRRSPTAAATTGTVVAAREDRKPIAAGPAREDRKPLAGGAGTTTAGSPPTPAPPPRVAVRPAEPKPQPRPPEPKPEPAVVETDPDPKPVAEPKPARPAVVARATASEVYFTIGNAEANTRAIARAAKWMNDNPAIQVLVEGHADPTGSADANLTLSERRAEWVKDQLVAAGIDSSRIEVVAHGDTKLKYGVRDARNRRVAIIPKP